MNTKILDCTLRDGGYYTNWDFSSNIINNYIKYTNDLEIEYLEIGYRNNKNLKEYRGQFYYTPKNTLEYFKKNSKHKIALMIDYKSTKVSEIRNLLFDAKEYVSLIRIAVAPDNLDNIQLFIDEIKKMDFKVALNIMYLSKWNMNSIKKYLSNIVNLDYLYLVDSYGAVFPDNLEKIISDLKKITSSKLGFHSHDNIELAFSNTLSAIKNEIDIVDSTILGMGRGSGNLKTELLMIKIYSDSIDKYIIYDALANLVETFSPLKEKYNWGSDISYKFAGINSYPQKDIMFLKLSKNYKFSQILSHFEKDKPKKYKLKDISYKTKKNNLDTIIIGGGPSVNDHTIALNKFLENQKNYNLILSSSKFSQLIQPSFKNCYQIVMGSDISKVNESIADNVKYIFPLENVETTNKNFYSIKIKNENKYDLNHLLSCISLTESISKSKNILLVGFDGFDEDDNFFNVFKANELILKSFKKRFNIISLTDTKYSVIVNSIYSML